MKRRRAADAEKKQYTIPALERAFRVLHLLATAKDGLTLSEISRAATVPKATLLRMLMTLERQQCVLVDEKRKTYRLGPTLWELGNAYLVHLDFYGAAIPHMQRLAHESGESVFLGILSEGEVIYVRQMASPTSVTIVNKLGQRVPAHCTATGEAILAFRPAEEVDMILQNRELRSFNSRTNTNVAELKKRLEDIRANKVAIVDGEYNAELLCVSSPILDETHTASAALTVAMLSSQAQEQRIREVSNMVRQASQRLSKQLGYLGDGFPSSAKMPYVTPPLTI